MKPRTFSAAATALATLTAGAFVLVPSAAHAGPLGAGETVLSGTTTPSGVGAASVAKVPGQSTYVAVWEGDRAVTTGTQQGIKREIFGRYVSSTGTPLGSPTRLISLGAAEDATLDATDPVVTTLSNGMLAVVYSGDVISDTAGGPTPVDTTSFQIEAATIDPTQALGALTPVTITTPGSPADPAFDQIHADATDDHGQLRIVWSGDTAATGDGQMEVWTTRVANGLTGTPTVQQVSTGHPTGSAYDNTYPRVAASAAGNGPDAVVVWEGVDSLNPGPVRRIRAARVTSTPGTSARLTSAPATSTTEELEPDIATAASGYQVVWSGNTGGAGYQLSSASLNAAGAPGTPTTITAGHHDTWPSVVFDPSQPGQYAVAWARRTSTAGTGHYELQTGRWAPASATPLEAPQQLSSVDANMSADNAESLRPDIAAAAPLYAVWARDRLSGGPGVAGRTIAASADLSTSITVNPTNPSPGRVGLHPADDVSVSVTYGNTGIGTVDAQLSLDLAQFQITSVDYQGVVGPTPTSTATPGVLAVSGLGPGDGGTAVFHGTLTSGTEGQTLTATSDITTTTAVADPPLNNSDATTLTVDYPPVVEGISRLDANPTNAASLRWQVSFDQPVSGVNAADFTLVTTGTAAGTVQSSTCSGATCTVTTSITGEGTIALRVPVSATIQDGSGKPLATGNLPFVGPEYTVDRTPPTVTVSTTATNPTNADPIDFTVTFSETVQRPTSGSLTVSGGTISGISPGGSASTYTVSVIPDGDGSVSLGVPAGATTDLAGNPNTAGAAVTTVSDTTRPTLTLTAPSTPQNGPFTVSVDASEPVTGLTASDFGVAGGSVTGLTGPTSASTGPWTLTITPTTEGTVTITAPAGSASDSAGNTNPVATTDVTYDATRPSVSVDSAAGNPTGTSPVPFTLTFSEPVTGLSLSDLSITGGTATLAGSGRHYTVSLTPAGEGDVSVAVPAGVATDAAGNTNTAGAQVTRTYDVTGPAATITTTSASPTGTATFPVTVTWDEPVSDFGAGDVTVSNGSVSAFSGSGATYTFDVTATADGDVSVAIPAGGVHDAATNPNPAATPLVVTVDTTKPTVTLTAPATDPTNAADVMVSVTFSEPVTGFALGDLVLVNATATDLNGSGAAYTVMVHPQGQGDFSVRVPADAAVDTSDNPSQASNLLTRTYDTVATADLTYSGPSLTNAAEHMTLTLSDPAPIVPSDFTLTNATVTVSGGPSSYDVVVTPIADGEVSVQLPAGAFTDAAGNLSEASPTQSFTFDATPPTVVSWSQPSIANDTFTVSVSMSEPVAALDPGLITVTNGQVVGQVNGAGTDWTFSVAGTADGPVDVDLATGAAYDAAGNPSVAFGPRTTTYDATSPTVSITSPTAAVVTTSPIPVEILFSEAVTGFDASDIYATNATITNFSGAGRRFTVDVVPSADGQVEVWVPALAAADLASNPSLASNTLVREYDSQRPTVALTTPVTNPTNVSSVPVQVQFSKAVLGFAESDLVTTNATVSGFTQVDSRTWTFVLTPISDGEVRVEIPEASSASAGGNLSFGGSLAVTVDRVAPTLELTGPASPTVNAPVRFTLTSSEPLSDLTAGDVVIGGSAAPTAATLTPVDATHWRIVVTGMTDAGTVRVRIPAGSASDAAGNATVRVEETAEWLPEATFRLLQAPGTRYANRISLPVQVLGEGRVTFSATSSNESLLPASRISLVGTGTQRTLVLDGRDVDGRSTVVLKVDIGTVTKRVTLTFITGNPGTSDIVGTDGIDVMLGRRGNDVIRALDGADHIYGGRGGDELGGGPGRDVLVGGDGGDRLRGGLGADAFVLMPRDTALDFDPATGDFKVSPAAAARSWFGI